uniref:hypothetical protein n=1 Tax=Paractinoplanes polyasparticus TaxID=2856853 RepID=UPI001C84D027|nr:hypothetical protein [Actinoplanes polyasparticus]
MHTYDAQLTVGAAQPLLAEKAACDALGFPPPGGGVAAGRRAAGRRRPPMTHWSAGRRRGW